MRMRIAAFAITIFFVLSVAAIPTFILSYVTKVKVQTLKTESYDSAIYSSGEIIEKRIKEIYLESPVIAGQVNVEIGDYVCKGQCLASVNINLTEAALSNGVTAKPLGNELEEVDAGELAAKYGLEEVDAGELAAKYGLDEADIKAAMGQYKSAPVKQSDMAFIPEKIIAPMNGVITAVNLQADVLTQTTKPVLVISDNSAFAARVSVNEADVARLDIGTYAEITGIGFNDKKYIGTVTKIYPTARKMLLGAAQQTVVDIEIALNDADANLKPGFSASAVIVTNDSGKMLTAPYTAIQQDALTNEEFVYVYNRNKVEKRYIKTGKELIETVEIINGLAAGERVVTNPNAVKIISRFAYPVMQEVSSYD
ncbi:MAG: efflux RND transporter periplasmic adaptor subunit [Hydrogenoanaerobacterium sp.]